MALRAVGVYMLLPKLNPGSTTTKLTFHRSFLDATVTKTFLKLCLGSSMTLLSINERQSRPDGRTVIWRRDYRTWTLLELIC
ncbi:hypothetical protein F2Q70_00044232 [Brassica cretica]|uniref:Uncharacterized protein n=1 Tax=Brassica cretica TaxID=69181 RepID=A0A8S9KCC7_BRACR|nr:hypothetical protein F2Q70_00044232 [Brassica cretica]